MIADRVRRPEDLGNIFTTPEDLRNLPAEDFLCREPQLVFETTGTSGGPKRVYFTYDGVGVHGPLRGRGHVGKRRAAGRPGSLHVRRGVLDQQLGYFSRLQAHGSFLFGDLASRTRAKSIRACRSTNITSLPPTPLGW